MRLIAPHEGNGPETEGCVPRGRRPSLRADRSILGGTAESIALWFKSIGHETWFYYYLTALIFESLVVYLLVRDTTAPFGDRPS